MKLIAPRNRHDILQSPLNVSATWPKDWELDLNPTKSEQVSIADSPHFVTYTLPSYNPPNTQTIPTVTTTKDPGIILNTRLSAEDNVVSAANKAHRMPFYLKRSFAALTPSIFLSLLKEFYPAASWIYYSSIPSHPISRRRGIGKCADARSKRASPYSVWSSFPTASITLSYTPANPWWFNNHV